MAARLNVEIKARCPDPEDARHRLLRSGARYVGLDEQRDTYFRVQQGRLKLREGRIENALIFYRRADGAAPKESDVLLFRLSTTAELREVLTAALKVDVVVQKSRHIYFIDNVKVHVDRVHGLGEFVEVEAIDKEGGAEKAALRRQCERVMEFLGVRPEHLVAGSYSDMVRAARFRPEWSH